MGVFEKGPVPSPGSSPPHRSSLANTGAGGEFETVGGLVVSSGGLRWFDVKAGERKKSKERTSEEKNLQKSYKKRVEKEQLKI